MLFGYVTKMWSMNLFICRNYGEGKNNVGYIWSRYLNASYFVSELIQSNRFFLGEKQQQLQTK
jgi:hypothetical protein